MARRKKKAGCGCLNFLVFIILSGMGYNWLNQNNYINLTQFLPNSWPTPNETTSISTPTRSPNPFSFPETVPQGTVIKIGGSTSMVQINQGIKQSFQKTFVGTEIQVSAPGSDKGIQALLTGEIEIAAISRPLTDREKQQGLKAITITTDAIAVMVAVNNSFRRGLTHQSVQDIFTGKITNWQQLRGADQPIKVINRPFISGTRQVFQQDVLKGNYFGNTRNFITLNQDSTTAILQALNNDGISYATYSQVRDQLSIRIIPIDGLIPDSPSYPYQRTLYYAYKASPSPTVKAFLGYATSPQGKQVIEASKFVNNRTQVAQNPSPKPVNSPSPRKPSPNPVNSPYTPKPSPNPVNSPSTLKPSPNPVNSPSTLKPSPNLTHSIPLPKTSLDSIRGIYLSRYQVTNNASETLIRNRVRYYKSQGITTIIHGVWGNGCPMYNSEVMQQILGFESCPNKFQAQWLD
ncbi:MAG: extracellular solute-binding protein, partial [Microcystaceae cyanobacterium]